MDSLPLHPTGSSTYRLRSPGLRAAREASDSQFGDLMKTGAAAVHELGLVDANPWKWKMPMTGWWLTMVGGGS